jgi:hypothetical protein
MTPGVVRTLAAGLAGGLAFVLGAALTSRGLVEARPDRSAVRSGDSEPEGDRCLEGTSAAWSNR